MLHEAAEIFKIWMEVSFSLVHEPELFDFKRFFKG